MIRILIADDHAIVCMGLASVLGTKRDFRVVGTASDGAEAVKKARELAPDVVLMDLIMPKMDGATTTAEIRKAQPNARVLILTSFGEADGIAHALDAGAAGALMKNVDDEELSEAIRAVAHGKRVVAPEITRLIKASPPVPELTERQREILLSMSRGLTDADIAVQLALTHSGIREHVSAIYSKLGAANRTEAVAIAIKKHLLEP